MRRPPSHTREWWSRFPSAGRRAGDSRPRCGSGPEALARTLRHRRRRAVQARCSRQGVSDPREPGSAEKEREPKRVHRLMMPTTRRASGATGAPFPHSLHIARTHLRSGSTTSQLNLTRGPASFDSRTVSAQILVSTPCPPWRCSTVLLRIATWLPKRACGALAQPSVGRQPCRPRRAALASRTREWWPRFPDPAGAGAGNDPRVRRPSWSGSQVHSRKQATF